MKLPKYKLVLLLLLNLIIQYSYCQTDSLTTDNEEKYQYDIFNDSSDYQKMEIEIQQKKQRQRQKEEKRKQNIVFPDYKKGDIDIYLSPFSIIWEFSPTFYIGTEYFFNDKVSIFTNVGYIFAWGTDPYRQNGGRLEHPSHISYTIKPELRFYKKNNPSDADYFAIKLMFRNMNYQDIENVFEEYQFDNINQNWNGIGNRTQQTYRIKRTTLGIQFIKGYKNKFFRKSIINFYYGIGARYVSNTFINKPFNPIESGAENDGLFERGIFNIREEYKMIALDMTIGLRIGGKIKNSSK